MLEKNCLIIAGEKSGEEHAMSFLPDIIKEEPNLKLFGVGGEDMQGVGVELLYHLKDFSSWGFSEVIGKIPFYFKALKHLENEVVKRNCKTAILIDFQDFNMRLAKRLKKRGVKVLYYVAPQAWAWKAWRATTLSRTVHTLFTILPFEKKWFKERGVNQVCSVPHPLWFHYKDKLKNLKLGLEAKPYGEVIKSPRVLLLPGSRNFEVKNLLPLFQKVLETVPNAKIGIVTSPNVNGELYRPFLTKDVQVWSHLDIGEALTWSHFSLAASGTVTLTCALFQVPTVVCYKTSLLNEYIFHTFLNYNGPISLANIVHNDMVFPEQVQEFATEYNIETSLKSWLESESNYRNTKERLATTLSKVTGELENVGEFMANVIKQEGGNREY
jgi:lipid-A-disaccharide synthase